MGDRIETDYHFAGQTAHGRWISESYESGLVSVIIPTFDRAAMLTEAMDSVWQQTYRPIELVIVDDGSTDNTQERIAHWRSAHDSDACFRLLLLHQENHGAPAARNYGARESRGEFIIWHDSDDLMLPDRVKKSLSKLLSSNADMCVCGFDGDAARPIGGGRHVPPPEVPDAVAGFLDWNVSCATWAWMYRRSFLARSRPWCEWLVCEEDNMFFQDCVFCIPAPRISTCPEVFVQSRWLPGGGISSRHQSQADYAGRLRYSRLRLTGSWGRDDAVPLRRKIVGDCLDAAIYIYLAFPEISREFIGLARQYGPDVVWGRSWKQRLAWRIGGRRLCFYSLYTLNLIRRIWRGNARRRLERLKPPTA